MSSEWSDVLQFTATDKTCCDAGDRVPAVIINNYDKQFVVAMWGNWPSAGNVYYYYFGVEEMRWYDIEIKQENVSCNIFRSIL